MAFPPRREEVPAQSVIHRQLMRGAPTVLGEEPPAAHVGSRNYGGRDVRGIQPSGFEGGDSLSACRKSRLAGDSVGETKASKVVSAIRIEVNIVYRVYPKLDVVGSLRPTKIGGGGNLLESGKVIRTPI